MIIKSRHFLINYDSFQRYFDVIVTCSACVSSVLKRLLSRVVTRTKHSSWNHRWNARNAALEIIW